MAGKAFVPFGDKCFFIPFRPGRFSFELDLEPLFL